MGLLFGFKRAGCAEHAVLAGQLAHPLEIEMAFFDGQVEVTWASSSPRARKWKSRSISRRRASFSFDQGGINRNGALIPLDSKMRTHKFVSGGQIGKHFGQSKAEEDYD